MSQQKLFLELDLLSYVLILKEDREEIEGVCVRACVRVCVCVCVRARTYLCVPFIDWFT